MFEGVATAHTCAHPTSNACTSLRRHCNTSRPSQASSYGSVHPHLAGNVLESVRASGIEKQRHRLTAGATTPRVGRSCSQLPKLEYLPKQQSAMGQSLCFSAGFNGSRTQGGKSGGQNLEFGLPCGSKTVQDCNRHYRKQRYDYVPNAPQWSQHRSGARFQNRATSAETRSVESFQQCHKIRQKHSSCGRLPLSPAPTPKQAGNPRATCRGFINRATASPAARQRMTGKYIFEVFDGSGFLTKATKQLGVRGHMLDTKFGVRCDVTQPFVLTRIRHDVSAGKCVAGMISPPLQDTSFFSKVESSSAAIANVLHRAHMPWMLNTRVIHGLSEFFRCTVQKANAVSSWKRGRQRFASYCSQMFSDRWTLQCFRTKYGRPKTSASRSKLSSSRDHTRPPKLSFRACQGSHHERTTTPENTSFEWNGIFTQRVKGYCYGSY